ncbi:MAG: alanyl-tRNA editing protein [Devosiaceae bacterium]
MDALFHTDSYLRTAELPLVGTHEEGMLVERALFYPHGGGQPGDQGAIELNDGTMLPVINTRYGPDRKTVLLVLRKDGEALSPAAANLQPGTLVTGHIDWRLRYSHMQVHTALHLLSAAIPHPVTGGQISDGEGRLDFSVGDATLDKEALTAQLQALVDADHAVSQEWITDAQLDAQPELVKTMSVQPPRGSGRVRLVRIGSIDLQPCGGTHVHSTAEIGGIEVRKIENKGMQNRRVRIRLVPKDAI